MYIMFFFFFNDTATTEIYTLSLHDALPISRQHRLPRPHVEPLDPRRGPLRRQQRDRKSTRLNSSHGSTSYATSCLKKKKWSPRRPTGPARRRTRRKPVHAAPPSSRRAHREPGSALGHRRPPSRSVPSRLFF